MRILLIGANGTIGQAVATVLGSRHEVISASRTKSKFSVDISQPDSIRAMLKAVGPIDAVVSAAGQAKFAPLANLSDADFQFCLENKLMGQVNLARLALAQVRDGGSITLTSGVLSHSPMPGTKEHLAAARIEMVLKPQGIVLGMAPAQGALPPEDLSRRARGMTVRVSCWN